MYLFQKRCDSLVHAELVRRGTILALGLAQSIVQPFGEYASRKEFQAACFNPSGILNGVGSSWLTVVSAMIGYDLVRQAEERLCGWESKER